MLLNIFSHNLSASNLSQTVKNLLSKCIVCKKLQGKPYSLVPEPPLPDFRVSEDMAFSKIAVDFAGPLHVRNIYESKGDMYKCYIALFTCASTRAIHLELTPDLTGPAFIRVLKRFTGRRGLPNFILSDNGQTFHDKKVKRYVLVRDIEWKFNVPTASWWGGFFEICVKLTKRCLKKVLQNAKLTYEELETVLIQTEGVLNSRPLTYVYEELSEPPLTPSQLVSGRRLLEQVPITETIDENNVSVLGKRACYVELLLRHFKKRWKFEYLTSICEFERCKRRDPVRTVQEGDIVHIFEDRVPRQCWSMGRVERLLQGRDGVVRAAEVQTLYKSKHIVHLKRPLKKLYPLEVRADVKEKDNGEVAVRMVRDEDVAQHIK